MQLAMSSSKMKSLLKGLRYISQVFESEKEEEIQIGNPTDVKHVAHIGWDGPSANATAPSLMTEFNAGEGFDAGEGGGEDDSSVKCTSEYGGQSRDLPKLPKSTRKTVSEKGSPTKEKSSDKTKRRSSNKGTSSSSRRPKEASEKEDLSSWPRGLPVIPKKSRRKKKSTKETVNGGSSRSTRRSDVDNMSEYMSDTGSVRSMPQFDNRDDF
ncbi:PREDICTED: CRIB domain-containing protein RIC6-like [Camelina sativa]|uniref:CRIB domain-containing protein RIC6-like n=1 Tax=Camelina sativa TaxID=90675 RepID=A0ABM0W9Z0_CAMSA|nr:PREDICTED: CRIB domain-containing protein RIC6-like [Camelina sativa]